MAALAFQNIIVGPARTTAVSSIGIEKMPLRFRLQFLGGATDRAAIVLEEREVRSADISAVIQEMADVVWPPHAVGLRLLDVDGRVVYEKPRADVGGRVRRRS